MPRVNALWLTLNSTKRARGSVAIKDLRRQNLGLRIVPTTGPYEVHVIESVEMPTTN